MHYELIKFIFLNIIRLQNLKKYYLKLLIVKNPLKVRFGD